MELIIRRFAGSFVLLSLLLAHFHSAYWLWFTAFVGFNLLQSSFTRFCPLEIILRKLGVGQACCGGKSKEACCCGGEQKTQPSGTCLSSQGAEDRKHS